jgi:hypothetical protein
MTTLKFMYVRAEIAFWIMAIQLLRESPILQKVLCRVHTLLNTHRWIARIPVPLIIAASGLIAGFLLGFALGLIRP